jgi:hypothetical protein
MSKTRILIPAYGVNVKALEIGLAATRHLCETHKCNALLLVQALKEARSTALNQIFSEAQLKLLEKGHSLNFSSGQSLKMCSPLTLKNHRVDGVIFAVFASESMIEKAEAQPQSKGLIVVTWNNVDANKWQAATSPKVVAAAEIDG